MKLEKQLTSLELSKRLKELGVRQESHFRWVVGGALNGSHYSEQIEPSKTQSFGAANQAYSHYSAFTVSELGEMLPFQIKYKKHICYLSCQKNIPEYGGWYCFYESSDIVRPTEKTEMFTADTEADARAKMLIYLIENDLLPAPGERG